MIKIKRGLDLPISGVPAQSIEDAKQVTQVAVLGADYVGMKPTMSVKVGDQVKLGQVLFTDKKTPGVNFTAPAAGTVSAINRGAQRVLQSVVIDVDATNTDVVDLPQVAIDKLGDMGVEAVEAALLASGLWSGFQTRPFSKVPQPGTQPAAIFVTAIDTHPLAADPAPIIAARSDDFANGLQVIKQLSFGNVYVCCAETTQVPDVAGTQIERFGGVHPAGLASTHIHMLDPVNAHKTVWTIGYQDVIAIGKTIVSGVLDVERVISIAGPMAANPRLLRTRIGASTTELCQGETKTGEYANRIISGSVLDGRAATDAEAFLGRYHRQLSILEEGEKRELMGWLTLGANKHSLLNIYTSAFNRVSKRFGYTTSTQGSERAMVPVGMFETVMPLDILPTQLLRALVVGDIVTAQDLGCLELEEADLALCTYACAGKYEYGPILRDVLTRIEKEC